MASNTLLPALPIPLHIELRMLFPRTDDRDKYSLKFGVAGNAKPAEVEISCDRGGDSLLTGRVSRGSVELPDSSLDALATRCFKLIRGLIIEQGGDSAWWTIADVTAFIRRSFDAPEADRVLGELARHVDASLAVQNVCLVADDDAI